MLVRRDVLSLVGGRSIGVLVLSATLLIAACGGDKKESTPTPTNLAATVAAPTSGAGNASGNSTSSAEPTTDLADLEATSNAMATTAASYVGKIDACKLVSREDAETIIGTKLSGDPFYGIEGLTNAKSFCNYNPASIPGTAVVDGTTIQLVALTGDDLKFLGIDQTDIQKFWDNTIASAKESEGYTKVDGIGDDAYFTTLDGLSVRKGKTLVAVNGLPLDKAKAFAQKALDNL